MPSRRVVLIGGAGIAAAVGADLLFGPGHTRHDAAAQRTTDPTRPGTPRDPRWVAAAVDERSVIAAYVAAAAAHPELAATLAVPLAHHRAHLAALTGAPTPAAAPTTPAAALPTPTAAVAAARRSTLLTLRAREAALSAARSGEVPGDLSGGRVLASIAACDAVHVDLLDAALAALPAPAAPSTSTHPAVTTSAPPTATGTPTPTPTPTPTRSPSPSPSRRTTPPSRSSAPTPPTTTPTSPTTSTTSPTSTPTSPNSSSAP